MERNKCKHYRMKIDPQNVWRWCDKLQTLCILGRLADTCQFYDDKKRTGSSPVPTVAGCPVLVVEGVGGEPVFVPRSQLGKEIAEVLDKLGVDYMFQGEEKPEPEIYSCPFCWNKVDVVGLIHPDTVQYCVSCPECGYRSHKSKVKSWAIEMHNHLVKEVLR